MTNKICHNYYWLLVSGGSIDSDFGLNRSHRSLIDLIIIKWCFHYKQLLSIVLNVMLQTRLYILFVFVFQKMVAPNFESIFECISDGVNKVLVIVLVL